MISVCIATYNGEKYIKQQLDSILQQLSDEDEVIISDDGSADATRELIGGYASPQIHLLDGPCQGVVRNFENALNHAKGDYIFLADQDDKWLPDKVKISLEYLKRYDCVVSDCYVTDTDLHVVYESFQNLLGKHKGMFYNLFIRNCYIGCCMAFNRRVLEKCLPFPPAIPMHDIWIGNVAACLFRVHFLPDRLVYFRRHEGSASSSAHSSQYTLLQKLRFRYRMAVELLKLLFFNRRHHH